MTLKTPKHCSGWKMEESYLAELFFKQYKEKNVNIAKTAERKDMSQIIDTIAYFKHQDMLDALWRPIKKLRFTDSHL